MILVYIGAAVWVGVIVRPIAKRVVAWWDRPIAVREWADARRDEIAARETIQRYDRCEDYFPDEWVREFTS